MIILTKGIMELYSADNVNESTLNDDTCFFSHKDGNNKDCTFVGTYKDLIRIGYTKK